MASMWNEFPRTSVLGERVLSFATDAADIQNVDTLGDAFGRFIGGLGASRFAALYMRRDETGLIIDRSISNLPRDWQLAYLQHGYDADDPVFQGVLRGGAYGYWSELTRNGAGGQRGAEVMGFAREIRMADGFTKRVNLDHGGMAVVMAAGEDIDRSPEARAALRIAFGLFANEGVRLRRLAPPADAELQAAILSPAEMQVLLLRREGLRVKAIANRLNRAPKTIETHVTAILRKLDAQTILEAINIATQRNIIT